MILFGAARHPVMFATNIQNLTQTNLFGRFLDTAPVRARPAIYNTVTGYAVIRPTFGLVVCLFISISTNLHNNLECSWQCITLGMAKG